MSTREVEMEEPKKTIWVKNALRFTHSQEKFYVRALLHRVTLAGWEVVNS